MLGKCESCPRGLLCATGLRFEQAYAGIRQHTFEEQSLGAMLQWKSWRPATASAPATAAAR
jgi:hypothetical protein